MGDMRGFKLQRWCPRCLEFRPEAARCPVCGDSRRCYEAVETRIYQPGDKEEEDKGYDGSRDG